MNPLTSCELASIVLTRDAGFTTAEFGGSAQICESVDRRGHAVTLILLLATSPEIHALVFDGGLRPHMYCLPTAKRELHRKALRVAATSGNPKFFLGTDSAPHGNAAKESDCGCAGIFNAPFALETYAKVFAEEQALDKLEGFASEFGPAFYRLPVNSGSVVLEEQEVEVPISLAAGDQTLRPFHAGATLPWRFVGAA